jgi:putative sterol carrier protein
MGDVASEFFEGLAARGHEPLLERVSGKVRFDITDGRKRERWTLVVEHGDLSVSRGNASADCIITSDKKLFEDIASGRTNAFAAVLRGALDLEGDVQLIVAVQRLLPGPPRSRRRRSAR